MFYLTGPYSHPDLAVRCLRFNQMNIIAGKLMKDGYHIFSPISHWHPIAEAVFLYTDPRLWESYNLSVLDRCTRLVVAMLPGWAASEEIHLELEFAKSINLPIIQLDPEPFLVGFAAT
jgi:hypothetical protein